MKIIQLRQLTGPNTWSVYHNKLTVLKLDTSLPLHSCSLYEAEQTLHNLFSSINLKAAGGNRSREKVDQHKWVAGCVETILVHLLNSAGSSCDFSECIQKQEDFYVLFSYEEPDSAKYAAETAVEILNNILTRNVFDISSYSTSLKNILDKNLPGPSTLSIIREAKRRNIPCIRLDNNGLFQLGYGAAQKRFEATIANTTSSIAVELACDKQATKNFLSSAGIPVPGGGIATNEEELKVQAKETGFPLVIKPKDGNQGKGATTNICSLDDALIAFNPAKAISEEVICEQYISGLDFRVLVINYQFVAAAMRMPACIKGNGIHSIRQLVDKINEDPRRGNGHENIMTKIVLDDAALRLLQKNGYSPGTILPKGKVCFIKTTANLSTGGTATDVTNRVHSKNIALFNRIARLMGLDICGIDIMAKDLDTPIQDNGGAVIEVNAAPGFRMHLNPSKGKPRNVAAPVIDMLFPGGNNGHIPIIAVTGTNGKTTTTGLAAHICRQQGLVTGTTSTNGIFIQEDMIMDGDCSGPDSALLVLKDPSVQAAVLECARGGILRRGLAFESCDVAIVTNVAEDHLGIDGIETLEELALVKAVVPRSVKSSGYAVLNADDDLVYAMKHTLTCNIALFSLDDASKRIKEHCNVGGLAAILEGENLVLYEGEKRMALCRVSDVPITFEGKAAFNIANALAAILAGYVLQFSLDKIRIALQTFIPSPEHTPGRLNMFRFGDRTVMIDYAHNPHGVRALGTFIRTFEKGEKTGIITGVGDRRDQDLIDLGREAGLIFDNLVIRTDDDLRGRTVSQVYDLINKGIQAVAPGKEVKLIPDEAEAIRMAITGDMPGNFVVVLVDNVTRALSIARNFMKEAKKQNISLELPIQKSYPEKLAI